MFPHVYTDIGLGVNHTGIQSEQLVAETLEVAPFRKILFSSDAWGLPELHLLGSWLFRRGLSRVLGRWVVDRATGRSRTPRGSSTSSGRRTRAHLRPLADHPGRRGSPVTNCGGRTP